MDPMYTEYLSWETRLATYDDKYMTSSKCSHSREELAIAGFFYTGHDDCVRCFYCGVDLRSWKPDDNVHVEHQRYRTECPFLQIIMKSNNPVDFGLIGKDHVPGGAAASEVNSTSEELSILRGENRYLKKRMICRMCFRHPTRQILLPCGDVVLCEHCTDIVTSCPSCGDTIKASASVFKV